MAKRQFERVRHPEDILSNKDVELLQFTTHRQNKFASVSLRMWLVGVECLCELLQKRLTAIIVLSSQNAGARSRTDQPLVSSTMHSIPCAINDRGRHFGAEVPFFTVGLSLAAALPKQIPSFVYCVEDELPAARYLPEIDFVFACQDVR